MLGSSIRVLVGQTLIPPDAEQYRVCEAHVCDTKGDAAAFRLITVGAEPTGAPQTLRVTAVTPPIDGKPCAVAAPDKLSMCQPQLRQQLGNAIAASDYELTCLNEKSCGAVVFRRKSGNTEFLLVKSKKGSSNWGFPKGHIEAGETETQTAIREVAEETGVKISPIEGFRAISEYHPKGKIIKQVVFFIAEMNGDEITIQPSEIDRFVWADYGLAMKLFRFNNDRNVLTKARDWLKRH